jgi:diguanylate cyclase (GGDEF)-like protein
MAGSGEKAAYQAGWTRVVLGVFGLVVVPTALPSMAPHRWLFAAYIVVALGVQYLIRRGVGGQARVIGMGLVDIGVLTYFVQRAGSATSVLVSLYYLIGTLNALVAGRAAATALAAVAIVAYAAVLGAESLGLLPYAPDGTGWGVAAQPSPSTAVVAATLVGLLLVVSTRVVTQLVTVVRQREAELLAANAQLEELSQRDPLTQLYNRRHLVARIEAEIARVRRGHAMAVLMIDLDGFKAVNDAHGHLKGDEALCAIARVFGHSTRMTDVAGRYGGDEFIVVLSDTDREQALQVAERLVVAVREACAGLKLGERAVTASIGVAVARGDDDVRALLRRADEHAYRAKQQGGDRIFAEA